ncbi:MAG: periplasmic heavy metal sensor [Nitrospira sp.]|nr:periplasmic heavy metal sensor [Nitrospira sp.]
MTKRIRRWMIVVGGIGVIAAMLVAPSFADEGHGKKGHSSHDQEEQVDHSGHYLKHLLKHAKEFELTQEQIGKLKAIQLDFKRSAARLEADVKVAKLELDALLDDEQIDLKAIQAKVEQLKKAEGACLFEAIKSKRTAMALLTPDQREKDRAHHEQMKSKSEGQHGGGMGGMGKGGMMGGRGGMGGGGMMGGMGGGMMGGGQGGHDGGDHGSGGSGGGQEHQH